MPHSQAIFLAVLSLAALTGGRAAPVEFDVPAQPAAAAVVALAKQASVEVLFSARDLRKIPATAVVGLYEPEAALALLLRGTGFSVTQDAAGKFIVERNPARAEVGEIRGVVVSGSDGRPIAGATVRIEGGSSGTRTDAKGAFYLREVPAAMQALVIQAEGYRTVRVSEIAVRAGRGVELHPVRLSPLTDNGVQELEEMTVSASDLASLVTLKDFVVMPSRFGIAEERLSSDVTLTNAELEKLPQIGDDLFRTITRLPGLEGDDHTAAFWVRGAPNDQVLSRFDGVDLIEPFHLKDVDDALSIIDLSTIASIDLVTGGFTTDYGDHLAGVLKMETQADPGAAHKTTLGLSITNLTATSQGEFADGSGQWLVAARHGYLNLVEKVQPILGSASPNYYDLSSKVAYRLTPSQTISLHTLYSRDTVELLRPPGGDPDLRSSYDSAYVWGRWQGSFGDRVSGEGVLSFSRLDWNRDGDGLLDGGVHRFTLRDRRWLDIAGLRQDWTVNLTPRALIRTGFEAKSEDAGYDYSLLRQFYAIANGNLVTATRQLNYALRPDGDYLAAYVAPRLQPWTPLIIEPGVRFERWTATGNSGWSPRLNAALTFGRTTLRAAWGVYEQAEGLQDLSVEDRETTLHAPERAEQRVLGLSHQLESGLTLRVEAYERLSSDLRPHWENPSDPYDIFPEAAYGRIELEPTRGRASGLELIAEHRGEGRFGWGASYAYADTEELVGGLWVPRTRDQRQTFYADVTYAASRHWQLSAAWQFHTGWPTTPVNYSLVTSSNGTLNYTWTYGRINSTRAPPYQRLDLRATRSFRLRSGTLRAFVDVFNAYDAPNDYGFSTSNVFISQGKLIVTQTPVKMFPILPNAGITWEF